MKTFNAALEDERLLSTYTGKALHLLSPEAAQIDIEDIAHGLAHQCCYNGHTRHFYSVAQHSLIVANLVPPQERLAALLHDAVTAYFGGLARAMQQLLPDFPLIEQRLKAAISERFGFSGADTPAIQRAHLVAQVTEERDLLLPASRHAVRQTHSVPIPRRIEPLSPEEAKGQFLTLFFGLGKKSSPAVHKPNTTNCPLTGRRRLGDDIRLKATDGMSFEKTVPYRSGLQAAWERAHH